MATFSPEPQRSNDPSYLGISQGTEKASLQPLADNQRLHGAPSSPNYSSDNTYGKIFAGVGDVLDTTTQGLDKAIKIDSEQQLRSRLESVRDQFGVAQASGDPNVAKALGFGGSDALMGTEIPSAVGIASNRLGTKLEGLKARYMNGDLQNSAYWSRAEAEVRAVRAQYKGYESHIDQKSAEILGTIPANALRQSVLQDVDQLFKKMQSASDKQTAFYHQNGEIIAQYYPDFNSMRVNGTAPSYSYIEDLVARHKADDAVMDRKLKGLNLEDKTDAANVNRISAVASEQSTTVVNRAMQAGLNQAMAGFSGNFQDYIKSLQDKATNGTPLTPQELEKARNGISQLRTNIQLNLETRFNQPWSDNDPTSKSMNFYFSKNPGRKEQLLKSAMAPIDALEAGITNPQTGLATIAAASVKFHDDEFSRKMVTSDQFWPGIKFLQDRVGNQAMPLVINDNSQVVPTKLIPLLQSLQGKHFGAIGLGYNTDFAEAWKSVQEMPGASQAEKSATAKSVVKNGVGLIMASQDLPTGAKFAQAMFAPSFNIFDKIGPKEEANNFLTSVTSPPFIKRMQELRDSGPEGQKAWKTYTDWTGRNTFTSVKQQGATLTEGISSGDIKVDYDPKTFQVLMEPKASNNSVLRPGSFLDNMLSTDYSKPRDEINKVLRNYAEVVKADGRDPTRAVYGLFNQLVNVAEPAKQGFFSTIGEAIKKQIQPTDRTPVEGDKKPTSKGKQSSNVSDQNIIAIDTKDIPEGVSARDFIQSLKDKRSSMEDSTIQYVSARDEWRRKLSESARKAAKEPILPIIPSPSIVPDSPYTPGEWIKI